DPKVKTMDSLQKSIDSLVNQSGYENHYVEIPSLNPETVIVSNKEIHSYISEFYREQQIFREEESKNCNIFEECDSSYRKFKKSAQKEVNYLVKEFECKKAADSYARATTSRTGVLDCSKLHTYKFNDDIFRKVTTLSDGKNHGLIFVLDWSGSMANVMLDTIKQLYNLIWFCKKVSIPFEVYAFTGDWVRVSYGANGDPIYPQPHYEKKSGMFAVDERFNLLNFLTSSVNGKTLEEQMVNLWRVVSFFRGYTGFNNPPRLTLSGTPLNESMISLHTVIPHFQKTNKVQKVQCVILTDGEAPVLNYHLEVKRYEDSEPYMGTRRISPSTTFIRDRKLGTTYKFGDYPHQFTDALLQNLRDHFCDVNFIGMRIMDGRDAGSFINRYCGSYGNEYDKAMTDWKKNKSFTITNSAYSGYFGMSSSALAQESEFEVSEDATKTQIKSAFVKSLKTKKLNKKILGEFVELIA
ncbi:peptidase, partial [Candidatus Bathyarchaeota archaeon]|nr:peptidase [Candidatus Bathyarchaeota archaeon]